MSILKRHYESNRKDSRRLELRVEGVMVRVIDRDREPRLVIEEAVRPRFANRANGTKP